LNSMSALEAWAQLGRPRSGRPCWLDIHRTDREATLIKDSHARLGIGPVLGDRENPCVGLAPWGVSYFEQNALRGLLMIVTSPTHPWRLSVTERPIALPPDFIRNHRLAVMQDFHARPEKLLSDARDCALISKLSPDPTKRATFARLALQLRKMAREVEADTTGSKCSMAFADQRADRP
jgi:hypothetical protein